MGPRGRHGDCGCTTRANVGGPVANWGEHRMEHWWPDRPSARISLLSTIFVALMVNAN